MKTMIFSALAFSVVLFFAGCSKDVEAQAVMDEFDALANEMVASISASPNAAGVDAAQKALDSRKASMKEKVKALKAGFVSEEMKKKYDEGIQKSTQKLIDMTDKYAVQLAQSPEATEKFQKLMKDFSTVFEVE